jgi:hypothetical protein
MFEKYARDITYIHHVIHIPTVRAMVDQVYNKLAKDEPVEPPQIALLLSIFASTTYSWTSLDLAAHPGLFENVEEANAQSPLWVKGCLDLVDRAGRCASRSVENIQAMIIAFFMLVNFEGITLRYTSLLNQAISMARDLGFHRLDHSHPITNTARPTPGTVAEEIGRRIWWYLSATDWYAFSVFFFSDMKLLLIINNYRMYVFLYSFSGMKLLLITKERLGCPGTQAHTKAYIL